MAGGALSLEKQASHAGAGRKPLARRLLGPGAWPFWPSGTCSLLSVGPEAHWGEERMAAGLRSGL